MSIEKQTKAIDLATLQESAPSPGQDTHSWKATVLTAEAAEKNLQCEQQEIWNWCLARVATLGNLQASHARLLTLLHWTPANIDRATSQAREFLRQMQCSLEDQQATWEYLSGECLARLALDLPFEHPGAKRQPVDLQLI